MRKFVLADGERAKPRRGLNGPPRFALFNLPPPSPPRDGPSDPNQPGTGMYDHRTLLQRLLRGGGFWRWLPLLVVGLLVWQIVEGFFSGPGTASACTLPYGTFYQQLQAGQVQEVTLQSDQATGTLKQPIHCPTESSKTTAHFQTTIPLDDQTLLAQLDTQVRTTGLSYTVQSSSGNIWVSLLLIFAPWLLLGIIIVFFMRRAGSGQQGVFTFGKSRAKLSKEDRPSTTFADVAGIDEAKDELQEVVEFLKTPEKFQRLGGRIPRGVLLVGPPGTGKTLLGRAVAGEAGVPFFSMSGSEFVEMLVGVGASRVRDLFEQARKSAPCIIFLDEIDAVGRRRGTSLVTNDEREQTLNQLLVEMDGFDTHQAVVVIAATNRPEGLDPALLRPGRFDRRVTVDRPDWKGRRAILEIHAREVPLSSEVDLTQLARMTTGMVGADLANLVNEAALLAARRTLDEVTVAYHEGGHALVGLLTPHTDPVTKVTIVPRGQTLGVTQSTPLDDRYNFSREELQARMQVALGGRAAEAVALGTITTGAENDLQRVTAIARQMVMSWGMSEQIGSVSYSEARSPFQGLDAEDFAAQGYSEATARVIDAEVHALVAEAYGQVVLLLRAHQPTLDRIAQDLRLHELLDAKQLQSILAETGAALEPFPNAGKDERSSAAPPARD